MGCGVLGAGFGVWGLLSGIWGLACVVWGLCVGYGVRFVWGLRFSISSLWFWVRGTGLRVPGSGLRVLRSELEEGLRSFSESKEGFRWV